MEKVFTESLATIFIRRGITTHRRVRRLLQKHIVEINDTRVFDCGAKVDLEHDKIFIDQQEIHFMPDLYLMMNKSKGSICSTQKDELYKNVYDFIPREYYDYIQKYSLQNLHTIGRLDVDTEGLLIFTTNGDFSHSLANPKFHIQKTYFIELEKSESKENQDYFCMKCQNGFFVPAEQNEKSFVSKSALLTWQTSKTCLLSITEGKFHQVKRMIKALGNKVVYLKRIAIGNLFLDESLNKNECLQISTTDLLKLYGNVSKEELEEHSQ